MPEFDTEKGAKPQTGAPWALAWAWISGALAGTAGCVLAWADFHIAIMLFVAGMGIGVLAFAMGRGGVGGP